MSGMFSLNVGTFLTLLTTVGALEQQQCEGPSMIQMSKIAPHDRPLRRASDKMVSLLQLASREDGLSAATREFLQALRVCTTCKNFERLGEAHDGGYVMCLDGLDDPGLIGMYSYGINGFDGLGMDLAKRYDVPLYEYDCFNPKVPKPCEGCKVEFNFQCITEKGGEKLTDPTHEMGEYRTLTDQLADHGHSDAADGSLLLKIDVEGAEWPIFAAESLKNLKKFRQVVMELHWLDTVENHPQYFAGIQNLEDAGLSIVHVHGNDCCSMAHFGKYSVPNVLEVTMVQREGYNSKSECKGEAEYLPEDQTNNAAAGSDLPEPKLPGE